MVDGIFLIIPCSGFLLWMGFLWVLQRRHRVHERVYRVEEKVEKVEYWQEVAKKGKG